VFTFSFEQVFGGFHAAFIVKSTFRCVRRFNDLIKNEPPGKPDAVLCRMPKN
jgi:hypothetical protein